MSQNLTLYKFNNRASSFFTETLPKHDQRKLVVSKIEFTFEAWDLREANV